MKEMGLTRAQGGVPRNRAFGTVAVDRPDARWATDFTTVFTGDDGIVAVVPVIDCGCRTVVGLAATKSQDAATIIAVVEAALEQEFGSPKRAPKGLELRTDHGAQYTGTKCRELCRRWRLEHVYAPRRCPTANGVVERVIRTMKEDCIWLRDWQSLEELQRALHEWCITYNKHRPHQSLGWKTPLEFRAGFRRIKKRRRPCG